MIQANELRIGNFIQDIISLEKNLVVYKIEDGIITGGDEDFNYPYLAETVKGIELTPDILDKIRWGGYIKFSIGSYFRIDDVGHLLYRSDYSGVNINYLHQLQNLYYLLRGSELEIVW